MKFRLRTFYEKNEIFYISTATKPEKPYLRLTNGVEEEFFKLTTEKGIQNCFAVVVGSKKMYIAKEHLIQNSATKKHPVMTAYTTDGYTVSASAEANSGWLSWYAFDGRTDRGWATGVNANSTITLTCPVAECLHKVVINAKSSGSDTDMVSVTIEGQLEDLTWVKLIDSYPSPKTSETFEILIPYSEQRKFKSFRATANHLNSYGGFMELQYYTYTL